MEKNVLKNVKNYLYFMILGLSINNIHAMESDKENVAPNENVTVFKVPLVKDSTPRKLPKNYYDWSTNIICPINEFDSEKLENDIEEQKKHIDSLEDKLKKLEDAVKEFEKQKEIGYVPVEQFIEKEPEYILVEDFPIVETKFESQDQEKIKFHCYEYNCMAHTYYELGDYANASKYFKRYYIQKGSSVTIDEIYNIAVTLYNNKEFVQSAAFYRWYFLRCGGNCEAVIYERAGEAHYYARDFDIAHQLFLTVNCHRKAAFAKMMLEKKKNFITNKY